MLTRTTGLLILDGFFFAFLYDKLLFAYALDKIRSIWLRIRLIKHCSFAFQIIILRRYFQQVLSNMIYYLKKKLYHLVFF